MKIVLNAVDGLLCILMEKTLVMIVWLQENIS
nr:MAG TPA: hypothetical protein [Bacteriophage sp.]